MKENSLRGQTLRDVICMHILLFHHSEKGIEPKPHRLLSRWERIHSDKTSIIDLTDSPYNTSTFNGTHGGEEEKGLKLDYNEEHTLGSDGKILYVVATGAFQIESGNLWKLMTFRFTACDGRENATLLASNDTAGAEEEEVTWTTSVYALRRNRPLEFLRL